MCCYLDEIIKIYEIPGLSHDQEATNQSSAISVATLVVAAVVVDVDDVAAIFVDVVVVVGRSKGSKVNISCSISFHSFPVDAISIP